MRILFIHGRDQQNQDKVILKNAWESALAESFKSADLIFPSDLTCDFPYFGNELIKLQKEYQDKIDSNDYRMRGEEKIKELAVFENELLNELSENAGIDSARAIEEFGPDYLERGLLNHRIPIFILRALDKYSRRLSNASILNVTGDVAAYLIVKFIRNDINNFIKNHLTSEQTVVIAHSLGSIIAYDVLSGLKSEEHKIKALITLGSPLGVQAIKRQLPQSPKKPACVQGDWLNIYDPRDVVSLNPLDKNHFDSTPPIINLSVDNTSDNRHGIAQYLDNPLIATTITKYLS